MARLRRCPGGFFRARGRSPACPGRVPGFGGPCSQARACPARLAFLMPSLVPLLVPALMPCPVGRAGLETALGLALREGLPGQRTRQRVFSVSPCLLLGFFLISPGAEPGSRLRSTPKGLGLEAGGATPPWQAEGQVFSTCPSASRRGRGSGGSAPGWMIPGLLLPAFSPRLELSGRRLDLTHLRYPRLQLAPQTVYFARCGLFLLLGARDSPRSLLAILAPSSAFSCPV